MRPVRAFAAGIVAILLAIPANATAVERWQPTTSDRLHIQLSGNLQVPAWATFLEIDGAESTADTVSDLHGRGLRVACYVSAGTAEAYRGDIARIPASVIGRPLDEWLDERWLDVRHIALLAPVMQARIADCARKGFDAAAQMRAHPQARRSGALDVWASMASRITEATDRRSLWAIAATLA